MTIAGGILMMVVWGFAVLMGIAFWTGAVIAVWMLILGKLPLQGPKVCPKCGTDLHH